MADTTIVEVSPALPDWLPESARRLIEAGVWSEPCISYRITQERICHFAELTSDRQGIHVDPAAARACGLPDTIAHGYFTLSLLTGLVPEFVDLVSEDGPTVLIGTVGPVFFRKPVPVNEHVRAQMRVAGCRFRLDTLRLELSFRILLGLKGEDPAVEGSLVIFCRERAR